MNVALRIAATCVVALVAIWLGYPAVVATVAAMKRRRVSTGAQTRSVTFILATRDETSAVEARIRNFLDTDLPSDGIEVVVAIDAAGNHGRPAVADDRVRVVPGDAPGGKAATLNAAVREARNEVLVFSDSAQSFTRTTARLLVDRLSLPGTGAVSGQLILAGGQPARTLAEFYWLLERALRVWESRIHSSIGVSGSVYAMRRELWTPLPAGLILDDLYVPMRLILGGWRIESEPAATATDARRFATAQEQGRKTRTLTGVLQLCSWMPGVLNPLRNPVWIQFVCHKLLRMLTPYLSVGCAVSLAVVYATLALSHRALLIATVAAGLVILTVGPLRTRFKSAAHGAWALQAAIVVATWNALRGRWDVWVR